MRVPGVPSDAPDHAPDFIPVMEDLLITNKFIQCLKEASLDNKHEQLDAEVLNQIRHPSQTLLTLDNPDDRLSIDIYLSVTNASEATYNSVRDAVLRRYPDSEILTYYKVKQLVGQITGIVSIIHDMCINGCIAYTGPFAKLDICTTCGQGRYDEISGKQVPRKQFHTIPIAPQLQALWRTPEGAESMGYRVRCTEKIFSELEANQGQHTSFTDFFHGMDYLEAVREKRITSDDMVLMLSIDGAQLYRNKISECWIYIWIIMDNSPDMRYKKKQVLPGAIIPCKPKHSDSFIYPGLHHLVAIQKEGLKIWDAKRDLTFFVSSFFGFGNCRWARHGTSQWMCGA